MIVTCHGRCANPRILPNTPVTVGRKYTALAILALGEHDCALVIDDYGLPTVAYAELFTLPGGNRPWPVSRNWMIGSGT